MSIRTRAVLGAVLGVAVSGAPNASAAVSIAELGATQELHDGGVSIAYTVEELEAADDTVTNVALQGELWEASVTVEAVNGTVTPVIPFFNARAADGRNYRVLFGAIGEEALSGAAVPQGQKVEGNIYFDVTGPKPTQVVCNDVASDRLIWE